jgi:hypothetical protein
MGGHFGHFERDETPLHGFSRLFTEFNLQPRDASPILDIKQRGFYKGGYFAFPPPSPKENGQIVSPDTSDTQANTEDKFVTKCQKDFYKSCKCHGLWQPQAFCRQTCLQPVSRSVRRQS